VKVDGQLFPEYFELDPTHPLDILMVSSSSTIFTLAPMGMNESPLQNKFTRANMDSR